MVLVVLFSLVGTLPFTSGLLNTFSEFGFGFSELENNINVVNIRYINIW